MAKLTDTRESAFPTDAQQGYLEALENSPLFYFSAGSKELFHSEFLYWLAKRHWDVFILVARHLADLKEDEPFWWEDSEWNLQVKREKNHFDLSIYHRIEANKWVPVFVLENKVKSLLDTKQLLEYGKKAQTEWKCKEYKGNDCKNLITLISLSLTAPDTLCNDPRLNLWTFKQYSDLADALENSLENSKMNSFHKKLCEDYCQFIRALYGLAESWTVEMSEPYLARLCPFELCADDKLNFNNECQRFQELVDVRLNDIWQKNSFNQLRNLLEEELAKAKISCKHFYRNKDGEERGFYLDTGYTRDTGLIELRYVLKKHKFKDEPVCVIIQLQGNQYRYAVTADKIIANKKIVPNWICLIKLTDEDTAHKIKDWMLKTNSGRKNWCHFGSAFIYRYRQIESSETVKALIANIVSDAENILNTFGRP